MESGRSYWFVHSMDLIAANSQVNFVGECRNREPGCSRRCGPLFGSLNWNGNYERFSVCMEMSTLQLARWSSANKDALIQTPRSVSPACAVRVRFGPNGRGSRERPVLGRQATDQRRVVASGF